MFSVENELIINDLSNQADGALSSVLVDLGHVKIVHEEHKDLAGWWTKDSTHAFVYVGLNNSLECL